MVKVKITQNKARIIDDSESTPGQSRQFDLFDVQVMPIFKEKNLDMWRTNFNKLDSDFYIASLDVTKDETNIIFKMNGEH